MMMTKLLEGRLPLAGLMVAVVATLVGATPPLNPLVIRADQPRSTVAEDCNVSLAAAPTPRVDVREIPLPEPDTPPAPPPSASLREALQNVQQAVARNDRAAFDVALARARGLVSDYPTGGERRGAEEVIAMYGDVERLWNAQYRSPFFPRESQEFAIANRYPGWEAAVRRSILTDATGTRFYPAGESRDFIATTAAERLRQAGLSAATPQPRTRETASTRRDLRDVPAAPRSTAASTPPSQRSPSAPTVRQTTTRQTTAPTTGTSTKKSPSATARRSETSAAKPAAVERQKSADVRPGSRSTPAPSRTATTPSTATREPSTATSQTAVAPSTRATPAATSSSANAGPVTGPGAATPLPTDDPFETATDSVSSALPTDPAASDGSDATTAISELPAAADPSTTDAATPSRGRSIILPLILILIGLGVLVVLFRMSS